MIPESAKKYVYYQEKDIVLLHGDCLEILPLFEPESVDLVLTDPPYGMNLDTDFSGAVSRLGGFKGKLRGNKYDAVINDDNFQFMDYWKHLKQYKKHVLFGVDYYMPLDILRQGSLSIWDKRLTDSADKIYGSCFETVWFNPKKKRGFIRYKWAGIFGMEKEDVRERQHPTQKPLPMIKGIMGDIDADLILDPFLGSGTTAVAAKQLGRKCIGIELESKYLDIAIERLRQEVLF